VKISNIKKTGTTVAQPFKLTEKPAEKSDKPAKKGNLRAFINNGTFFLLFASLLPFC
jgi:hypothetical protein